MKTSLDNLMPLLEPLVVTLVGLASMYVTAWLRANVRDVNTRSALVRLNQTVATAVLAVEQTTVRRLKDAMTDDGILSDEERVAIKDEAIADVIRMLGTSGSQQIAGALGHTGESLRDLISMGIEAEVGRLKKEGSK